MAMLQYLQTTLRRQVTPMDTELHKHVSPIQMKNLKDFQHYRFITTMSGA